MVTDASTNSDGRTFGPINVPLGSVVVAEPQATDMVITAPTATGVIIRRTRAISASSERLWEPQTHRRRLIRRIVKVNGSFALTTRPTTTGRRPLCQTRRTSSEVNRQDLVNERSRRTR